MTIVGFHASHEQVPPARLLHAVQRAEEVGFDAAMCSDHLAPWSLRQGESGFAWSWLGSALQATRLPFGVVTAPGQRYHPAIAAQAIATLESMYPGRFWAALGSGEAVNEHVTGDPYPPKEERDARLRETVTVIRRLLAGEEVSADGLIPSTGPASGACPRCRRRSSVPRCRPRPPASAPSGPTGSSPSTSRATPSGR